MRRKSSKQTDADRESDILFAATHSRGVTTEELGDLMIATVQQMSPDEKAHLRAKLHKVFGKNSNGAKIQ